MLEWSLSGSTGRMSVGDIRGIRKADRSPGQEDTSYLPSSFSLLETRYVCVRERVKST